MSDENWKEISIAVGLSVNDVKNDTCIQYYVRITIAQSFIGENVLHMRFQKFKVKPVLYSSTGDIIVKRMTYHSYQSYEGEHVFNNIF